MFKHTELNNTLFLLKCLFSKLPLLWNSELYNVYHLKLSPASMLYTRLFEDLVYQNAKYWYQSGATSKVYRNLESKLSKDAKMPRGNLDKHRPNNKSYCLTSPTS